MQHLLLQQYQLISACNHASAKRRCKLTSLLILFLIFLTLLIVLSLHDFYESVLKIKIEKIIFFLTFPYFLSFPKMFVSRKKGETGLEIFWLYRFVEHRKLSYPTVLLENICGEIKRSSWQNNIFPYFSLLS